MKKNTILIGLTILLVCFLFSVVAVFIYVVYTSNLSNKNPGSAPSNAPANGPAIELPAVFATPDPQPVGLYAGLASLNSYRMKMRTLSTGPTAMDYNESITNINYNQEGKQLYSQMVNTSSSQDSPTKNTSTSEEYRLDTQYCQRSIESDGYTSSELTDMTQAQQAVTDAMFNVVDVVIVSKDAKFVSEETVNGVLSNHFTFTISGLGATGTEVTQSQGEYWVAKDGQYLVKYQVTLETRSGPADDANAQASHFEMLVDISDINSNITIQMPTDCVKK
jgi:hypothetical protein